MEEETDLKDRKDTGEMMVYLDSQECLEFQVCPGWKDLLEREVMMAAMALRVSAVLMACQGAIINRVLPDDRDDRDARESQESHSSSV